MKRPPSTPSSRRARARLEYETIREGLAQGAIGRGEAADLLAARVVAALPSAPDPEDRPLLRDAEILRATLCLQSGVKTPLDAATAFLFCAEHEEEAPFDDAAAVEAADLARSILDRLRPLRSKRRSFRVFMTLARLSASSEGRAAKAEEIFERAPEYLDGAERRFSPTLIGALLDWMNATLARDATLPSHARDRLQAALFRHALALKDARRATEFFPGAAFATVADSEALAACACEARRMDDVLIGAIENGLRLGDAPKRRLERALRTRAAVPADAEAATLADREGLNRRMTTWFRDEAWPWRNLLEIAVQRRRPAAAFAAFARLAEVAEDVGDAPRLVAPLLLKTGFRRLAAEFGDARIRALAEGEIALSGGGRIDAARVAESLERTFRDDDASAEQRQRAARILGRLAFEAGRPDEAIDRLEQALSRQPGHPEISGDLAEVLASKGDFKRAAAFVVAALEGGETPRLLELHAATAEAEGAFERAALRLRRAVLLDRKSETESATDRRAAIVAEAERAYAAYFPEAPAGSSFLSRLRADAETGAPPRRDGLARPELARRRAAHLAARAGRHRDVLDLLDLPPERLAKDRDLALLYGRALIEVGRPAEAAALLEPLRDQDDGDLLAALGDAFVGTGRADDARAAFEAAKAAGAIDAATLGLLRADLSGKAPREAAEAFARAASTPGLSTEIVAAVHAHRATALEAASDVYGALEACARSLERRDVDSVRARYARIAFVAALDAKDDYSKAELLFRALDAVKGATHDDARTWGSLASLALGLPPSTRIETAADRLADRSFDCGPSDYCRAPSVAWLREAMSAPPREFDRILATPSPSEEDASLTPLAPFEPGGGSR